MSAIAFPLALSVELFGDRRTPEAVTRVKEAAILYDELHIEHGLLDVKITPNGTIGMWLPRGDITEEALEDRREAKPGIPTKLTVAPQPGPDQPATGTPVTLVAGEVRVDYVAQFHTVMQELQPDWVHGYLAGSGLPDSPRLREAIRELNFRDMSDRSLLPDLDVFERKWTYEAFNRDMVLAADLKASVSITPLFRALLDRWGLEPHPAGDTALAIEVPNLAAVPWEAIIGFREHPGCEEARAKLREFEHLALDQEPEDAYTFLKGVSQETVKAYTQAWNDLRTNLPEELAEEVAKFGISVIPVVGAFIEKGATIAEAVYKATAERRTWIAALMELKQP